MDEFDLKILDIVQRDNRLPTEKIAERVGLSPSAVQRRLKRLRKDGIIEADVAIISPEMVGRRLTAIVEVTLQTEGHISPAAERFKRLMLDAPEVMQCYHVTGDADIILVVTVRDIQEYEAFTRRYFVENASVRRYKTSIVINRVKAKTLIPLSTEEL
ncbi:MAG: Lrp/AsnC family transcriptional regulator [Acidobacteriota bacterium]|nr:Lrp/AsnC family transcriptional regulator [Acidobacteriota bacterium]